MKQDIQYEIAIKHEDGHWITSTVLWPKDKLKDLTFDEFVILREINLTTLERHGKKFNSK